MVSTCVILSGMTNVLCLLYVGWITNYVSNNGDGKVAGRTPEKKFEEENRGETLRIIERLDRLESVVNQHIQGNLCCVYMTCVTVHSLFILASDMKMNTSLKGFCMR